VERLGMRPAGEHPHPASGARLLVFERFAA
jgi:hypothetical protein